MGPYLQYAHVSTDLADAQEPRVLLLLPPPEQIAAETLAEQPVAREIAFFVGHVLGRCPDGVVHARAERGGHVGVPARACDLERVGDRRGQGRGGHVALFVC